jgi:carboxymethylenebutenolidase
MLCNQRFPPLWSAGRPLPAARLLIVLTAVVLLGTPAGAQTIQDSAHPFQMEGQSIAMQCFTPAGEGRHPAVLLLHGSEGMKDERMYRHIAQILAKHGYVALIVHYFERTETKRIEPKDINEKLFAAWMETVRQAVLQAARLPGVDGRRIGLLGFSLGAYLSLAVATEADLPIAAVAELFGGLPEKLRKNVKRLPPTLIIHGDADKTVPVEEALALAKLFQERKRPYEIKIYEGQDHLFQSNLLGAAARDARDRTLDFLAKHLKPLSVAGRP